MALTRRRLLASAGGAAAAHVLLPAVVRGSAALGAAPPPHTRTRNRLVVIHLDGGNDGLNTVVPRGGSRYEVYKKVRPTVGYTPSQTLPLDLPRDRAHALGLNKQLDTLHRLYRQGRLAIVQGVDYPEHSYSHFTSADIWHSGEPGRAAGSGWLGRHLDRSGVADGELRGVGIGNDLPLMLRGERRSGLHVASVATTRFADGGGAVADARHDALALFEHHTKAEPLRRVAGHGARQAVDLVDSLAKVKAGPTTGDGFGDSMLSARTLLSLDLGVECVVLRLGGFDNHTTQRLDHERQLAKLDNAIEAFFEGTYAGKQLGIGTLPSRLAERTVVVVVSEFGRRIGETGAGPQAGTDHGAAAPVLVIGPKGRINGGLHGEQPSLGSTKAPADNLLMTTDLRRVYRSVLDDWLRDPDPLYRRYAPLPELFV